jgi:hypothetical protein
MVGGVALAPTSSTVQQYPVSQSALRPSKTVGSPEDTVQLSDVTQRTLAPSTQAPPQPAPTLGQLVRDAANGDISAFARLAVIG